MERKVKYQFCMGQTGMVSQAVVMTGNWEH